LKTGKSNDRQTFIRAENKEEEIVSDIIACIEGRSPTLSPAMQQELRSLDKDDSRELKTY
jgi:hypothetical protein